MFRVTAVGPAGEFEPCWTAGWPRAGTLTRLGSWAAGRRRGGRPAGMYRTQQRAPPQSQRERSDSEFMFKLLFPVRGHVHRRAARFHDGAGAAGGGGGGDRRVGGRAEAAGDGGGPEGEAALLEPEEVRHLPRSNNDKD